MKKIIWYLLGLAAAVLIIIGAVIYWPIGEEPVFCPADAKLCADGTAVGRSGPDCEFALCPAEIAHEPLVSTSQNMKVWQPASGSTIGNPVVILGSARVFENAFNYRVKDANGKILGSGFSTANALDMGQYGPFSVALDFETPTVDTGTLEVFDFSAKDGAVIDLVSIPVRFSRGQNQLVKAYFGNNLADPQVLDCARVFSVYRYIEKTNAPARAALGELLEGPTADEKQLGYFSSIQNGSQVTIKGLAVVEGVAKADFNAALEENAGGSCRVSAIRSQITQTLKQFELVDSVVISIEGRSEDILQP